MDFIKLKSMKNGKTVKKFLNFISPLKSRIKYTSLFGSKVSDVKRFPLSKFNHLKSLTPPFITNILNEGKRT